MVMFKKFVLGLMVTLLLLVATGCGKPAEEQKQEDQRQEGVKKLHGSTNPFDLSKKTSV